MQEDPFQQAATSLTTTQKTGQPKTTNLTTQKTGQPKTTNLTNFQQDKTFVNQFLTVNCFNKNNIKIDKINARLQAISSS